MIHSALVCATLLQSRTVAPSGNLVANGSFETGQIQRPFDRAYQLDLGYTDIDSWRVIEGNLNWNGSYFKAYDGSRSVDLNGTESGALAQTVSTVPGRTYLLTFWLSGNPDGPPLKTMQVRIDDAVHKFQFHTAQVGAIPTDMKWERMSLTFRTRAEETRLVFASTTTGRFGPVVDQVELSRVIQEFNR
ncbi:MAG TPA: choice-of-anchor C family protein [Fimbriimonadaceae bacterium]|nr:choice-of-anchor C family protein [Fimbriimonadaceae bacterium]HRJ32022.1 choice-of-anchor C family protein [Fimbriimonadaceae bacterium]